MTPRRPIAAEPDDEAVIEVQDTHSPTTTRKATR